MKIQFLKQSKLVVMQPIGKSNSIENFLIHNRTRWAEKHQYEMKWLQSVGSLVLFTKDGVIFAKATINSIDKSEHPDYPLNYHYDDLEEIDTIDYKKVVEYAELNLGIFRKYELLDEAKSSRIISYINSMQVLYLDEHQADYILQNKLDEIDSIDLDENPQKIKEAKEVNGRKLFPRNLAYAKKALENAKYQCEINMEHTTFSSKSSEKQYVEAHHLIPLNVQDDFKYSLDVPANIVALCPNCHRKIHYGIDQDTNYMLSELLSKKKEKLLKYGISVSFDELHSIYLNGTSD